MGMNKALVLALLLGACKQTDKPADKTADKPAVTAGSAGSAGSAAMGSVATAAKDGGPKQVEAAPPPKLLDKPTERRLYSDRLEASSFLWTDWNKFQENYHANYILDGDPKTAWVEGADGSGAGEWVRIHISPVEGATKIRLRVRNGYQKSKELFAKNARVKQLELVAVPSGAKQTVDLEDAMDWQEVAFEQPAGKLDAIELRVASVVEGSKYTDLCISDVELYVTALNAENPAFEKSKLDELLAWKKKRLADAKLLGGARAKSLPILAGYRVDAGKQLTVADPIDNKPNRSLRAALAEIGKLLPTHADATKRATAAVETDFAGWVRVQVVAKDPIELPEVDGLRVGEEEERMFGMPSDAFLVPGTDQGMLVRSANLTAFDVKGRNTMNDVECKVGKSDFLRPPRKAEEGPVVRELLHVECVSEETREGKSTYMIWQLLEFDAEGNLVLTAAPNQGVQAFEWQKRETGPILAGGVRLDSSNELQKLVANKAAAQP